MGDVSRAVELAEALFEEARQEETARERHRRARMTDLMSDPAAQSLATTLTDRLCRPEDDERIVAALLGVLRDELPHSLPPRDRLALSALRRLGEERLGAWGLIEAASEGARRRVIEEASAYLVPASELTEFLDARRREGCRVNLNRLGEEVIGEDQARLQVEHYRRLLERDDVSTISVKLSSLFSQVNLLAFDESREVLASRLRSLYAAAAARKPSPLIYLDMESYRDLELSMELLFSVLGEPRFERLQAGVALQAYVPDSLSWQRRLIDWAVARRKLGGAPLRMRLVKGANLAMERVESSLRGWPLPVHPEKALVDQQFKEMLRVGCDPLAIDAVRLGVGSHNVFDVAYALTLREQLEHPEYLEIEMLEGLADSLRRAVQRRTGQVLVYTPTVHLSDLPTAVAYLVRRFDESTDAENFLAQYFGMSRGDDAFQAQKARFVSASESRVELPRTYRDAARGGGPASEFVALSPGTMRELRFVDSARSVEVPFENEPDTDLTRSRDRLWLRRCLEQQESPVEVVPVVVGDRERFEGPREAGFDPSRPGHVPYVWRAATVEEVGTALIEAVAAVATSRARAFANAGDRVALLRRAAEELRKRRGKLISAMVLDAGKRAEEADAEVSEAIDFASYYASELERLAADHEIVPRGVVVVTPPWNFPLAIPLGGVLAALAAGNAVILKPAPETVLVGYVGAQALWDAGVPKSLLQFAPCRDRVGSTFITDRRVSTVVLTGASSTARLFRRMRPDLHLLAETGGKNSLIISAISDHELAIRDTVRSAFGHAGQKCSALSLLIVESELYRSEMFQRQLADAVRSLPVGSAWDAQSFVTPLIAPPSPTLQRGLALEGAQRWLVEPRLDGDNPRLLSPGVRYDTAEGDFAFQTELFGPVLSVVEARNVEHALHLANRTPYGLTAGFHGLDESEQAAFIERMEAGNLYVNRTITGAIVQRQPFGGRKASSFGPGAKAGGPGYLPQFCHLRRRAESRPTAGGASTIERRQELRARMRKALGKRRQLSTRDQRTFDDRIESYVNAVVARGTSRLTQRLTGELNWFRHQAAPTLVWIGSAAAQLDIACVLAALELIGAPHQSVQDDAGTEVARLLAEPDSPFRRVRALGVPGGAADRIVTKYDVHVDRSGADDVGESEVAKYLLEQSVAVSCHRYGNLARASKSPRPLGLLDDPRP